jgi:hypothetical protein
MKGTAEPLLQLIEQLQSALNAGDGAAVITHLKTNPALWEVPRGHDTEWDEYADLLVRLAQAKLPGTLHLVQHAVGNVHWMARSAPEIKRLRGIRLLNAADQFVADDESKLMRFIDSIEDSQPPCPDTLAWLDRILRRQIHPHVQREMAEGVRLAYLATPRAHPQPPFMTWEASWPVLTTKLYEEHGYVRTYAARLLGDWYRKARSFDDDCACKGNEECGCEAPRRGALKPSFKQMLEHITALELASPGVAGPFLNAFAAYDDFEDWTEAGVDPAEWVLHLIENRRGYDPQEQSNFLSLNFLAHEMLVSEAHLIRLVRAGYIGIAAESACDSDTDFLAILNKMRNNPAPIARDIFEFTLSEYGWVRQDLAEQPGVCRFETNNGIECIFLEPAEPYSDEPHRLVIRATSADEALDDAAIWRAIDNIAPANGRGAMTDKRRHRKSPKTMITFENGVSVILHGLGGDAGWMRASLISNIPFHFWRASGGSDNDSA